MSVSCGRAVRAARGSREEMAAPAGLRWVGGWLVGDDSEPFLAGSFACRVVGFFFFNFFPLEFRDVENLLVDSGAFLFFLPFIFSLKPPDRLFFFFFLWVFFLNFFWVEIFPLF